MQRRAFSKMPVSSKKDINITNVSYDKDKGKYTLKLEGKGLDTLLNKLNNEFKGEVHQTGGSEDYINISLNLESGVAKEIRNMVWQGKIGGGDFLQHYTTTTNKIKYEENKKAAETIVKGMKGKEDDEIIAELQKKKTSSKIIYDLFPDELKRVQTVRELEEAKQSRREFNRNVSLIVGGTVVVAGGIWKGKPLYNWLFKRGGEKIPQVPGEYVATVGNIAVYDFNGTPKFAAADTNLTKIVNENSMVLAVPDTTDTNFYSIREILTDSTRYTTKKTITPKKFDDSGYELVDADKFVFDKYKTKRSRDKDKDWSQFEGQNKTMEGDVVKTDKGEYRLKVKDGTIILTDPDNQDKAELEYAAKMKRRAVLQGQIIETVAWPIRKETKDLCVYKVDNVKTR